MGETTSISRRQFVAGASGMVLAGSMGAAGEKVASKQDGQLALHGGKKAVQTLLPRRIRWGQPERERLEAMLGQGSLFFWKGPQTELLKERFRKVCPVKYAQTCSSGTAALHIAVAAAGVCPGDEVITSPITDIGTVIGILFQQAVPVFADLDPATYNLDPVSVERHITPKTKAIIAVHLLGNPCDLDALKAVADRHNLVLIEDCAQAWGARYRGRPIGSVGHIACFSLQDSKHVTCGDGGMVGSSDERFGPLLARFGDKGFDRIGRRDIDVFGTNYRMSEPQAAVAAAQLERLESIAARRAELGNLLTSSIATIPGIRTHRVHPQDRCVYWLYMFRIDPKRLCCDKSLFARALAAEGVPAWAGYIRGPLYTEPIFQEHSFFGGHWPVRESGLTTMDYAKVSCPEAEAIHQTAIRLGIHEHMSEQYVLEVAAAIKKVASHYAA